jgi:hypothetical protein
MMALVALCLTALWGVAVCVHSDVLFVNRVSIASLISTSMLQLRTIVPLQQCHMCTGVPTK